MQQTRTKTLLGIGIRYHEKPELGDIIYYVMARWGAEHQGKTKIFREEIMSTLCIMQKKIIAINPTIFITFENDGASKNSEQVQRCLNDRLGGRIVQYYFEDSYRILGIGDALYMLKNRYPNSGPMKKKLDAFYREFRERVEKTRKVKINALKSVLSLEKRE